jgi:hypothetical protein
MAHVREGYKIESTGEEGVLTSSRTRNVVNKNESGICENYEYLIL